MSSGEILYDLPYVKRFAAHARLCKIYCRALIFRLAVRSPAPPVHVLNCPWTRRLLPTPAPCMAALPPSSMQHMTICGKCSPSQTSRKCHLSVVIYLFLVCSAIVTFSHKLKSGTCCVSAAYPSCSRWSSLANWRTRASWQITRGKIRHGRQVNTGWLSKWPDRCSVHTAGLLFTPYVTEQRQGSHVTGSFTGRSPQSLSGLWIILCPENTHGKWNFKWRYVWAASHLVITDSPAAVLKSWNAKLAERCSGNVLKKATSVAQP